MADLTALTAAVEAGNRAEAVSLTQAAIDEGTPPQAILDAMTAAMTEVGAQASPANEGVFVPEMLIAARAMKEALKILEPMLVEAGVKTPRVQCGHWNRRGRPPRHREEPRRHDVERRQHRP